MQATLFNAPRTGFNVMAASDAIGMGLNLNIRYATRPCHVWMSQVVVWLKHFSRDRIWSMPCMLMSLQPHEFCDRSLQQHIHGGFTGYWIVVIEETMRHWLGVVRHQAGGVHIHGEV